MREYYSNHERRSLLPCTSLPYRLTAARCHPRGSMLALIPRTGKSSGASLGVPFKALLHPQLQYTSVPSVLHAVEGYRHFKSPQCQKTLEALKMAATYSPTTCSTIGVAELNDPVRNGKGWDLSAITT